MIGEGRPGQQLAHGEVPHCTKGQYAVVPAARACRVLQGLARGGAPPSQREAPGSVLRRPPRQRTLMNKKGSTGTIVRATVYLELLY
jgi:hypothetical protein